jgi:glycosyltransferase involved in cell wall biosynthesis
VNTNTRVVIASRMFPPEVGAGAFRLGALASALARRGYDVRVTTTKPPRHVGEPDDPGDIGVSRWPVLRDAGGNVRGYVQYLSYDVPLLFRLLFTRFDIAVAESPPTTGIIVLLVAAVKRRRVVYYAADVWTDGVISMGAPRWVVATMRWLERTVLRHAARIISVSDEVTERLRLLGAPATRVLTVGNGIDTDVFAPTVDPASEGLYFVYTGTMSEWQQPAIFVRAFALVSRENPEVMLRFYGQGSVEAELRDLADELLPSRITFGGVVSPAVSAAWIRGAVASLVSIVPGIGYDFAKPTKTYAAAGVGTPVLFAGPETGADLVRTADLGAAVDFEVAAVADAMRALLAEARDGTSEAKRGRRAEWARENVSLRAVADRVVEGIAQALDSNGDKLADDSGHRLGSGERPEQ